MILNTYDSLNRHVNTCLKALKSRIWALVVLRRQPLVDIPIDGHIRNELQHPPNLLLTTIGMTLLLRMDHIDVSNLHEISELFLLKTN